VEAKLILSILFEAKVFMFYVPPGAGHWFDINALKTRRAAIQTR
jgi:hypothetical protein